MSHDIPLIPNAEERRRIFYMLKKNSSYTAWARVAEYHWKWLEIYKLAAADDAQNGTGFFSNPAKRVAFAEGMAVCLERLRQGDKQPFKYLGQAGYFYQAHQPLSWMATDISRYEMGENALPAMASPYWDRLVEALVNEGRAEQEVGAFILEGEWIDNPAPLDYYVMDNRGHNFLMEYSTFPEGELPPVPEPEEQVFLRTKDTVPYSGIWEPVKVDYTKGVLGLFQKPIVPDAGIELDGLMNYLHVGSPAPSIAFPGDDLRNDGRPTTWRLIWRDDRYEDGTIPDEEAQYTFRCPEWPHVPWPQFAPPDPNAQPDTGPARCPAGQPCPRAGYWISPAKADSRRLFKQGEIMPELGADYGATIWQWDTDQA